MDKRAAPGFPGTALSFGRSAAQLTFQLFSILIGVLMVAAANGPERGSPLNLFSGRLH